ncbi:24827_t:CDS:10 [Cetraspora pellucida]|uniref:24827_t:CDS:1 n=1 Tax=Cetraspora pellucida TaxID=1433469 RepID=A0A9N9ANM1_9GLOM|nr:24827_t:CDS:10 [Cetraspora pellucida]
MSEEFEVQSFEEDEVEFFEFKQLNKNALSVQLSEGTVYPEAIPPYPSLLVISNIYGFFVAATNKGFIYASTKAIHELFEHSNSGTKELLSQKIHCEISEGHVRCLRLSSDQLTLIVGIEGGHVLFYDVTKFASEQAESKPFQRMSFQEDIKDLRPNPGERHSIIAILLVSGVVYIKDYFINNEISKIEGTKVGERFTAMCWSQKGKQIICGNHLGQLIQFTPEGTSKATIQPPPDFQQQSHFYDFKVQNILWLEAALFVVAYFPVIQEEDSELEVVTNLKCLTICASANSADINLIVQDASNNWTSLLPTETNRAALPLSEIHDFDTLPVGLAIDFTCTESWVTRLTGDENTTVPPVPILYILNDECDLVAYRCFHKDAFLAQENFSGMAPPKMLPATGHSSGINSTSNPTTNPQNCTVKTPAIIPDKTELPITAPVKTASPIAVPIKTASPVVAPIKTASPVIAPIKTASPVIAPIKTASPIVAPIKTASPIVAPIKTVSSIIVPTKTEPSNNNFLSPKKIIPTPVSTPSRNLSSAQQSTSTETDIKTPHMIRLNATENEINDLHNRIEGAANNYIVKYHDRTTEQYFENHDTWSIGDLPVITSEINLLEHEASSMTQALVDLRNQVNEYSHDVRIDLVKAKTDIEHLMCTPSNMITVGRRGILQSRIKERLETTFKTVKESAQALETQLNALHEQIQEKKSNKSIRQVIMDIYIYVIFAGLHLYFFEIRQSPLEYIDRSIRNISKGLYRNASQIEQLSAQLDQLTLQISSGDGASNRKAFVSHPINRTEPNKAYAKNISYSVDAAKATAAYLNKERICEKLKNINKFNRKDPVKNSNFEDNEDEVIERKSMSPIIISPKKSPSALKPRAFSPTQIHEGKPYRSRTTITSPLRKSVYPSESSSDYQFQPKAKYDTPIRGNTYTDNILPEASGTYQDYEDSRPFIHDDIYTLPGNLGIQEINHATEVTSSIKFQEPIEFESESSLSFGDKTVESDELNLDRVSPKLTPTFISKDNEITQESSTLETTSSYQDKEVQYSDSYRDETQDSVESKIVAPDVSGLSKASEFKQSYNNFVEDPKSGVLQLVSDTIEDKNSNELMGVSENFGSFGLGEPSETHNASGSQGSFGLFGDRSLTNTATSIPAFGKQTFGTATSAPIVFGAGLSHGGNATGIPPAFATQPSNVNAFNSLPANPQAFGQPSFGQTGFGQSSLGVPKAQAFGQPAFGQPAFGQHGFGQARTFGAPSALSANLKPPSGSGFARFASNNAFGSVNNSNNAILGTGGNSFDGTNASINTTKSSFMEFRG